MVEVSRFWDVGEEFDKRPPNLGKTSVARIFQALLKCGGKLHSYVIFGDKDMPEASRDIVYRISLPIGREDDFEMLSGYVISQPPKVGVS